MNDTDLQLLSRFLLDGAEDAFTEIVRRHLNLVYSAALRQVRAPQLAEEVAQTTFTDLAKNAHRLAPDTVLAAWLYQVTRRKTIDVVRREARRQAREQIAREINAMSAPTDNWSHLEPLLDEAMQTLDETDRTAVLLRHFENKSLREVGQTIGASEGAAQKRVSRALDRLRDFMGKRGVTIGTGRHYFHHHSGRSPRRCELCGYSRHHDRYKNNCHDNATKSHHHHRSRRLRWHGTQPSSSSLATARSSSSPRAREQREVR